MRNKVYSRYIYQMLMEFGKVSIPTLGTFSLQYSEAAFKNNKSILSPPSSKLVFSDVEDDQFYLAALLDESGMKVDDAHRLQNLIVEDYTNATQLQHPFDLDGLGTMVTKVFLEKDIAYFDRYHGLDEIGITPLPTNLKNINHNEDYLYRLNTPVKSQEDSLFRAYLWPLLAGLFVLTFILIWLFTDKNTSTLTPAADVPVNEPIVQEIIADSISVVDTTNVEKEIIALNANPDSKEEAPSSKPVTENLHPKPLVSNEGNTCVVIVGAFKNLAYAKKLQKRIEKSGYKSYTGMHDGMKRVGVSFNCSSVNPDEFKTKVKKIFNQDAWYLHDTL